MKKTTIFAACFMAVAATAAHAEINNDLSPGDRIKARWEDQSQESTYGQWRQDQHSWAQMNNEQRAEKLQQADEKYYSKNIGQRTSQAAADDKVTGKAYTPEQRAAHRSAMHKKWAAMTPEQKAAAKAAHEKKMANMTPEQKAAHADRKAKMASMTPEQKAAHKAKWDSMTPEQKAAAKAKHKSHMMHKSMSNTMTNGMTNTMSPATTPATGN